MKPIEEMSAFFTARVEGYDEHMLTHIEGMAEAYAQVCALLPGDTQSLLDLGCGTGLELEGIFARFPCARVTGIDLTQAMLDALAQKYAGHALRLVCGSYFDVDFGTVRYNAAASVESLHHFTHAEKLGLYRRVCQALVPGGRYIEADYIAATQAEEDAHFARRDALLAEMGAPGGFFHYDTPCTVENQLRLLGRAGFARVRLAWQCGSTAIFVAEA